MHLLKSDTKEIALNYTLTPYIVRMHTAQDHAVNLHGRRLNIVCGTVEGKNEG